MNRNSERACLAAVRGSPSHRSLYLGMGFSIVLAACSPEQTSPEEVPGVTPPGADTSAVTGLLETGARLLQDTAPLDPFDIHLVGFHPMKDDAHHQMEAHHFCHQVNEDFAQCVLFDGAAEQANLNGIEYIISEQLFDSLPEEEKAFWHPHNYEILSGQLLAPGIPQAAELELMSRKMNSYGKTWHVWSSLRDALPLGAPMLGWSFNRDGEADDMLIEQRDARMNTDTAQTREQRQSLVEQARPQQGVDALLQQFLPPTQSIPGVMNRP